MNEDWFREPEGGRGHFVGVAVGVLDVILVAAGWGGRGALMYLFGGLWLIGLGGAELLPPERTRAAGILRIGSFLCMLAAGGVGVALLVTA